MPSLSRTNSETAVVLSGPGWWGVINLSTTLLCPSTSPLPPLFIFGSGPVHSCVIAVAQCLALQPTYTPGCMYAHRHAQMLSVCAWVPEPTLYTIMSPPIFYRILCNWNWGGRCNQCCLKLNNSSRVSTIFRSKLSGHSKVEHESKR